ncbi:hypothetical protein [Streptococcus dysgalactiae]|nr:hypothetical protein [Streptococcus dysgalactiae]
MKAFLAGLLISSIEDFKKEQERFRRRLDILYSRVQTVLETIERE